MPGCAQHADAVEPLLTHGAGSIDTEVVHHYDHDPPHDETGRTVTDELVLRCASCHRARHGR